VKLQTLITAALLPGCLALSAAPREVHIASDSQTGHSAGPSEGWSGTVRIRSQVDVKSGNGSADNIFMLDCKVEGSVGHCTVSEDDKGGSKDSTLEQHAHCQVTTTVHSWVENGKTVLEVGMIRYRKTIIATIAGTRMPPTDEDAMEGGWKAQGPGSSDPHKSSGTWSLSANGGTTTITWNLTYR
jgi:hypothetical protein